MHRFALIVGVTVLALAACGDPEPTGSGTLPAVPPPASGSPTSAGPFDPSATVEPNLMVMEPSVANPGDELAVSYPGGRERGIAYVLEKRVDGIWYAEYFLTASTDGYGTSPTWWPVGAEGYGWEDIGIAGLGPDSLIVPESALAGDYRICTANSRPNICAEITILKADDAPSGEPGPEPSPPFVDGDAGAVADLVGLALVEFEAGVTELGLGPVRVAWRDGEHLDLNDDLVPGRVNVAVETRDGAEVVVDARVEVDPQTGSAEPEATLVATYAGVEFYPACGNEWLDHEGIRWYQVQSFEYPEIYERAANGYREQPPETVTVRGFAPRVAEPGPGDDVGTLVVWSDGVAYFVSDSGDLYAWLVDEELTYEWVC